MNKGTLSEMFLRKKQTNTSCHKFSFYGLLLQRDCHKYYQFAFAELLWGQNLRSQYDG